MRYYFLIFLTAAILCLPFSSLHAEYIFIKDGSIIKGNIISDNTGAILFKTTDGKKQSIKRGDIMRILYTELTMGKILVQKKNGDNLTAFMVDEDRETYTFRNDLYKPQEFKLNRNEVLFVAERAPSGMKGEA